jgi:hypothetical protein
MERGFWYTGAIDGRARRRAPPSTEPMDRDEHMSQNAVIEARRQTDRRPLGRAAIRRRGRVTGKPIHVRLQPELLAKVDEVRAGTSLTRPELVRLILADALLGAALRCP